jgi:hypothetical protein
VLRSNPLDDWRDAAWQASPLKQPVLITFDDSCRSVVTRAAPVLVAYELRRPFCLHRADGIAPDALVRRSRRASRTGRAPDWKENHAAG